MNILFALTYSVLSMCLPSNDLSHQEHKWEITVNTNKEQLETIQKEVKANHAELVIHKTAYNNEKLTLIKLTLTNAVGEVDYFNDNLQVDIPICLMVSKRTIAVGCCNTSQN